MSGPLHVAFLGCGFITDVHSRQLRALGPKVVATRYASRDLARAETYRKRFGGVATYGDYLAAIADPAVQAVVIAVPPAYHLDLTLRALDAGKHVLVEKPAYLTMADYQTVVEARNRAGRVVLVGENDHYKPLAVSLRSLVAKGTIGEMVFAHFTTIAHRLKKATTGVTTKPWPAVMRSSKKASTGCTWRGASARRSSRPEAFVRRFRARAPIAAPRA